MASIAPLREFTQAMTRLVTERPDDERALLDHGTALLQRLVANDDWLPDAFAQPSDDSYRQYLLHCDPLERFSVVSFVWQPGQRTPLHDHTTWGLVAQLRGEELCQEFARAPGGGGYVQTGEHPVRRGDVDRVSPTIGDVHIVSNASTRTSISIHVYGGNIGAIRRHVFDPRSGEAREFVSGYHNRVLPNLWDRGSERQGASRP